MLPKYFYSSEFKYFKEWSIIVVLIEIGTGIRSILLYSLLNIGTLLSLGSTGFVLPVDGLYDITQHMVQQLVKQYCIICEVPLLKAAWAQVTCQLPWELLGSITHG